MNRFFLLLGVYSFFMAGVAKGNGNAIHYGIKVQKVVHDGSYFKDSTSINSLEKSQSLLNSRQNIYLTGIRDTLPKNSTDSLKSKDISKESIEDSDFVIKNPRHTIKILRSPKDNIGKPFLDTRVNSRKAWLFSLVVPGLGQYYNHSYLKIPIIYGLLITMGVLVSYNQTYYQQFLSAFRIKSSNLSQDQIIAEFTRLNIPLDYANPAYTPAFLSPYKDSFRRNRDLSIIGAVGVWAINAIDAFVVSELKGFDVSNDLSIRIRPAISPGYHPGSFSSTSSFNPTIKLTLNFK